MTEPGSSGTVARAGAKVPDRLVSEPPSPGPGHPPPSPGPTLPGCRTFPLRQGGWLGGGCKGAGLGMASPQSRPLFYSESRSGMSWSVILNDVQGYDPEGAEWHGLRNTNRAEHPEYPGDMDAALALAKTIGLTSAALTGMRAPNPYGGDEVVDVSVRGFPASGDFVQQVRQNIDHGPGVSMDDPNAQLSGVILARRRDGHAPGEGRREPEPSPIEPGLDD